VLDVFQFTDEERFLALNADAPKQMVRVLEDVVSGRAVCSPTHAEPPIKLSSLGAGGNPIAANIIETISPRAIACTAARAAPSGFFSPIRRATIAVAPIPRPIATAYIKVNIDSVRPTVATASAPRCATQKISTTAKMLSINISSTIGIARRMIERPMGPVV